MSQHTVAVIPARMGSNRYPGKPLRRIHGIPMVEHVYRRVAMSGAIEETYVTTPDEEIRDAVEVFGGKVVVTGSHSRGTDRVAAALGEIDAELIVKVHTDEPMITPDMVDAAVKPVLSEADVRVVNLARQIQTEEEHRDPNNVKVVTDHTENALYYSRAPIPAGSCPDKMRIDHQVCVVPMERDVLLEYRRLEQGPLERAESIDMLRLLEHGYDVRIVRTDTQTRSVDTRADHERASEMMKDDELFHEYGHSD